MGDTPSKQGKAAKYRPVLTARQIVHIVNLAKKEAPISNASLSVISTLSPFLYKIENGAIAPSHVPSDKPKANSLESLGAGTEPHMSDQRTKEERWEQAYNKYKADPTSCTATEILEAREHMYLNDLMSDAEVLEFEAQETTEQ